MWSALYTLVATHFEACRLSALARPLPALAFCAIENDSAVLNEPFQVRAAEHIFPAKSIAGQKRCPPARSMGHDPRPCHAQKLGCFVHVQQRLELRCIGRRTTGTAVCLPYVFSHRFAFLLSGPAQDALNLNRPLPKLLLKSEKSVGHVGQKRTTRPAFSHLRRLPIEDLCRALVGRNLPDMRHVGRMSDRS